MVVLALGSAGLGQVTPAPADGLGGRPKVGLGAAPTLPVTLDLQAYGISYTLLPEPWKSGSHTGEDVDVCIRQFHPREDMDLVVTAKLADANVPTATYLHRLLVRASEQARIDKQARPSAFTISSVAGEKTDWEHTTALRSRYTIAWIGRTDRYVYTVRVAGPAAAKAQVEQTFTDVSRRITLRPAQKAGAAATRPAAPLPVAGKPTSNGDPFITSEPKLRVPQANSRPAPGGDPFITSDPKPYTLPQPRPIAPSRPLGMPQLTLERQFPAPPAMPATPIRPASPLASAYWYESQLGYKFGASDSRLGPAYGLMGSAPEAEMVVSAGNTVYGMALATPLFGEEVDAATFVKAALHRFAVPWSALTDVREVKEAGASGYSGAFKRVMDSGARLDYRFKALRGDGRAVIVLAWSEGPSVLAMNLVDSLSLTRPRDLPALVGGVRPDRGMAYAQILNEIGLEQFAARKFGSAVSLFQLATRLHESKPIYMQNLLSAMEQAGSLKDALPDTEKALKLFPADAGITAEAAMIHHRLGNRERAMALYAQAVRNGMNQDAYLESYVDLLLGEKKLDEAERVAEQANARAATARVTAMLATVYQLNGKPDKGIRLVEDWMARSGPDADMGCVLMSMMASTQRYADVLKVGEMLRSAGRDTARVWYWIGGAHMGLKQYQDARQAYDKSLSLEASDTRTQEARRIAASMLGEGDRRALAEEIPPVQVPARLLTEPPGREKQVQDRDGLYLYHVTAISYKRGEDCVTTEYLGFSPTNQEGVRLFNPIRMSFDPLQEEICLNRMVVRDEQAKVVSEGTPADAHIMDEPSMVASYRKVLTVPLPGLKPGYTAHLAITRRKLRSATTFDWCQHVLTTALPVGRSAVVLRGTPDAVRHVERDCSPTTESDGSLVWEKQWPAVWKWEPAASEPSTYLPTVSLGESTSTWAAEGASYLAQLGEFLAPSLEAKALWETLGKGAGSEEERLERILEHVQTQYTYQAIVFGRRARTPQPVANILANRYGDCKDHSLLTYQLLQAAGLPAKLALVRTDGALVPEIPSLDQFDHMICWTKIGGQVRFLDTTFKSADIAGGVPYGLEGKTVLLLDSTPYLVTIPEHAPAPSVVEVSREMRIRRDGDAEVSESASITGLWAGRLRGSLAATDPVQRRNVLRSLLNAPAGMDVSVLRIEHLGEPGKPLVLEMKYGLRRHLTLLRGELIGSTPALLEATVLTRERCEDRQSPLVVRNPVRIRSKTTVSLEGEITMEVLPDGGSSSGDFGAGTSRFERTETGYIASLEAELKTGEHPAGEYSRYCDELRNVLDLYTRPVLARVGEGK